MQHKHKILSEADWYVSFHETDCDVEELKVWALRKMKLSLKAIKFDLDEHDNAFMVGNRMPKLKERLEKICIDDRLWETIIMAMIQDWNTYIWELYEGGLSKQTQ